MRENRESGRLDQISDFIEEEGPHVTITSAINIGSKGNPYVFLGTLVGHGFLHYLESRRGEVVVDREIGALSTPTPISTIPSKRRQGRAVAEHGKHGGPRRESRRGGRARRKECPKGHYWSYKEKKCVKSKFR